MVDFAQLLIDRPDVLAEAERLRRTADQNSPWAAQHAVASTNTNEDFARWWYDNYGRNEGYGQAPPTPAPTAVDPTPGPVVPDTNNLNGNPLAPVVGEDPYAKVFQSITDLLGGFNSQISQQQAQQAARDNARNSVYSTLGTSGSKINTSLLDQSINDILGEKYSAAQLQLDRGKERGQYNDVGYAAGLTSLERAKEAAKAKLMQTGEGILSGYRSQYDQLRNDALGQAETFSGQGTFDLSPYQAQANDLLSRISTGSGGALREAIGGDDLFDLNAIRGDVGEAQGSLNLKDMSIVDALAKRKKVDALGRGLGSQGAF